MSKLEWWQAAMSQLEIALNSFGPAKDWRAASLIEWRAAVTFASEFMLNRHGDAVDAILAASHIGIASRVGATAELDRNRAIVAAFVIETVLQEDSSIKGALADQLRAGLVEARKFLV